MIVENSTIFFETEISDNQNLTFEYAEKVFKEKKSPLIKVNKDLITWFY